MATENSIKALFADDASLAQALLEDRTLTSRDAWQIKSGNRGVPTPRLNRAFIIARQLIKSMENNEALGIDVGNNDVMLKASVPLGRYLSAAEISCYKQQIFDLFGAIIEKALAASAKRYLKPRADGMRAVEYEDAIRDLVVAAYGDFYNQLVDFDENKAESILTYLDLLVWKRSGEKEHEKLMRRVHAIKEILMDQHIPMTPENVADYYNNKAGADGTGYSRKISVKQARNYLFFYKRSEELSLDTYNANVDDEAEPAFEKQDMHSEEDFHAVETESADAMRAAKLRKRLMAETAKYSLAQLIIFASRIYSKYKRGTFDFKSKYLTSDKAICDSKTIMKILSEDLEIGRLVTMNATPHELAEARNKLSQQLYASIHVVTEFGNPYGRGNRQYYRTCSEEESQKLGHDLMLLQPAFQEIMDYVDEEIEKRMEE